MSHPLKPGKWVRSPGQGFAYRIEGPVCRLYDREELPWPSCSLQWRGKQPSWNRQGSRFVADLACSRCPSYAVTAVDKWGTTWSQILTIYYQKLGKQERQWWVTKKPLSKEYPPDPVEG